MRSIALLLLLLLTGCASVSRERFDSAWGSAIRQYGALMITPKCVPEEWKRSHTDSLLQFAQCGNPIYEQYEAESGPYMQDCKKTKVSIKDCSDQFSKMMFARLVLRYPYGDAKAVETKCTARPKSCSRPDLLEAQYAQSHNEKVKEMLEVRLDQINSAYARESEQESERRRSALASGLQQISDGFNSSGSKLNCTSYRNGNVVDTSCR